MVKTISETALKSFAFFLSLEGLRLALQHCYLQSPSPRRRQTVVHGSGVLYPATTVDLKHSAPSIRPLHADTLWIGRAQPHHVSQAKWFGQRKADTTVLLTGTGSGQPNENN